MPDFRLIVISLLNLITVAGFRFTQLITLKFLKQLQLSILYPAYKDQKWKEIKELLLKKFDIVMISLSTFLNPESELSDSVVTEIYEITEKRK